MIRWPVRELFRTPAASWLIIAQQSPHITAIIRDWDAPNPEDIENGKLYRKALGIVLRDPTDSPGGDRRLFTRRVVAGFPEMTRFEEVFAVAERQTGVPLSCDPALKIRRFSTIKIDQSLAQFMLGFTHRGDTKWVRDGRGYRFVPVKEAAEESSDESK